MSTNINLREAERKAFVTRFQDGLADIFIGSVVLMFAVAPFLSPFLGDFWSSAIFLPFWGMLFIVLWLVKKHIVLPRIGRIEYGSWRKARMIKFNITMVFVCILGLILGILSLINFSRIPGWMHVARFSLLLLIGFVLCAYFLEFKRLYLYGVLIALSPLIGELLYINFNARHHGYPITFGFTAGLIIIIGLLLFIRLLRNYPLPPYPLNSGVGNA